MARIIQTDTTKTLDEAERMVFDSLSRLSGEYAVFPPYTIDKALLPDRTEDCFFVVLHMSGHMLIICASGLKNASFADTARPYDESPTQNAEKILKEFKKNLTNALRDCESYNHLEIELCIWFPFADTIDNDLPLSPAEEGALGEINSETLPSRTVVWDSSSLNASEIAVPLLMGVKYEDNKLRLYYPNWENLIRTIAPDNKTTFADTIKLEKEKRRGAQLRCLSSLDLQRSAGFSGPDCPEKKALLRELLSRAPAEAYLAFKSPAPFDIPENVTAIRGNARPAEKAGCHIYVWDAGAYTAKELSVLKSHSEGGCLYAFYDSAKPLQGNAWLEDQKNLCCITLGKDLVCTKAIAGAACALYPEEYGLLWKTVKGLRPCVHIVPDGAFDTDAARKSYITKILAEHGDPQGEYVSFLSLSGDGNNHAERQLCESVLLHAQDTAQAEAGCRECIIITDAKGMHFNEKRKQLSEAVLRGTRFVHIICTMTPEEEKRLRESKEMQPVREAFDIKPLCELLRVLMPDKTIVTQYRQRDSFSGRVHADCPVVYLTEGWAETLRKAGVKPVTPTEVLNSEGDAPQSMIVAGLHPGFLKKTANIRILSELCRKAGESIVIYADAKNKNKLKEIWDEKGVEIYEGPDHQRPIF